MAPTLMALSDVFLSFLTFFLGIPAPTSGYIVWILCSAKFFYPLVRTVDAMASTLLSQVTFAKLIILFLYL